MIGYYHIRRFVTWEVGGYQFGSQWDRRCYVGLASEEKVFDEQDLWSWVRGAVRLRLRLLEGYWRAI